MAKIFGANHPQFGGAHALATPCASLANPCLALKIKPEGEWDAFGLPVSSTVIQELQAHLGGGDTTASLYLDASRVRSLNPDWNALVDKTAMSMLAALGLIGSGTTQASTRVNLKGLHVCPMGSHM